MPTGKEMCETIVQAIKLDHPEYPHTPKEFWEASPTGELAHVFFAYEWAKNRLSTGTRINTINTDGGKTYKGE